MDDDRNIINHPWGQSQDWTNDVKGYSPTHWLSGPPRAPYGYDKQIFEYNNGQISEVPEAPFNDQQIPLEGEQDSYSPYGQIYPSSGVTYAPQPYSQYSNKYHPDSSQNTRAMDYTTQNQQSNVQNQQQQNQSNGINKEEKTDWYKVLYTGSIILMGIGSIAVAAIQYKMYSEKKKQKGTNPYHYDVEREESQS